ncbi:Uncharacterised protein [Mycobacteroides abscessus subsp. massiliense]|nr:Uncharacterised protein [Mycobacteroides abscessus subsp. massiliense]
MAALYRRCLPQRFWRRRSRTPSVRFAGNGPRRVCTVPRSRQVHIFCPRWCGQRCQCESHCQLTDLDGRATLCSAPCRLRPQRNRPEAGSRRRDGPHAVDHCARCGPHLRRLATEHHGNRGVCCTSVRFGLQAVCRTVSGWILRSSPRGPFLLRSRRLRPR